jgi:hypothetical protein
MDRVRFIEHRGIRVLLLDYSNLHDEQPQLEMIEERVELVAEQPPGSLLVLVDATGAHFSRTAIQRIKEANVLDKPFVRRSAMVGADTATPKGAIDSVGTFAAKNWGQFSTREEALDWLTESGANSAPAG